MVYLKEFVNLRDIRRKITNAFSEKGQEAADAIRALIDELEGAEVEIDETMLAEKINEVLAGAEPNSKTEEAIANAIAKRMTAIQNGIKKELDVKVKNQICAAVLRCSGKEEVKNAVNAVLVKNDITGLTFEDAVDYTIVESWGDLNPLFKQLHKTLYTKFHYNEDELKTATILAKQWDKTKNAEKVIQELAAEGKRISTKYIYKRQRVSQEDLDDIELAGETTNFLRFINEELDRQIVNTIVMAILIGDTVNTAGKRITTFESIGTKTTSDVFTTVVNPATAGSVTLTDCRNAADAIKNPNSKRVVAVLRRSVLTEVSSFTYGQGGTTDYRSRQEIADKMGVDEIIESDLLDEASGDILGIFLIPDGYWYKEKNALSVAFPKYEENTMNYMKERNVGGAIHDLYSTAVLRKANA